MTDHMSSKSSTIYAIADALQITLTGEGEKLYGRGSQFVDLGSLNINFPIQVYEDVVIDSAGRIGVFVHFRGDLWAYLIAETAGGWSKIIMIFFPSPNGAPQGDKDIDKMVKKLIAGPAVAAFKYVNSKWDWIPLESLNTPPQTVN